jgi:hypothetical protein
MINFKKLIFFICFLLNIFGLSQAKEWRGIVPLHSTRKDVERLIGPPTTLGGRIYNLENEVVLIDYSHRLCEQGWTSGWNVPLDTVTSITVNPRKMISLSEFGLDLSGYQKVQDPEVDSAIYYVNREEGIYIRSLTFEPVVVSITYLPAAKDRHLLCSEVAARSSKELRGINDPSPFIIYHDVSVAEEKGHLNSFAKQLQSKLDSKGFIIVYGGQKARAGEAKEHATFAKNYLINKYGVKPERVVAIDGGFREKFTVELYVIPRDMPEPLTSPTIRPRKAQITKASSVKNSNRRSTRPRYK